MAMGGGCLRTGLTGCFGLILLLVICGFGLFIFKPKTLDRGVDWMLCESPPEAAQLDPGGAEQTERFFRAILALSARNDRLIGQAQLSEGQLNAYLQDVLSRSKEFRGLKHLQAGFLNNRIDFFAILDPAEMDKQRGLREVQNQLPSPLRDRKVSLRIRLEDPVMQDRRFGFRQVYVYVGRSPFPVPATDLKPLLKLLPGGELTAATISEGIPLPANTKVTILPSKIQVTPAP